MKEVRLTLGWCWCYTDLLPDFVWREGIINKGGDAQRRSCGGEKFGRR